MKGLSVTGHIGTLREISISPNNTAVPNTTGEVRLLGVDYIQVLLIANRFTPSKWHDLIHNQPH